MNLRRVSSVTFFVLQIPILAAFAWSFATLSPEGQRQVRRYVSARPQPDELTLERDSAYAIAPLYDDPGLVSDEQLAAVLQQIVPHFPAKKMKPNHVEHALRTWHVDAEFQDPDALSGVKMRDFLIDHGRFLASWEPTTPPLLEERPADGVVIRWDATKDSRCITITYWPV